MVDRLDLRRKWIDRRLDRLPSRAAFDVPGNAQRVALHRDRAIVEGRWPVAAVVRGLESRAGRNSNGARAVLDADAVRGFVDLRRLGGRAGDMKIRAFAERYGRLGVCACGQPLRARHVDPRLDPLSLCRTPGESDEWEPLDAWRSFSQHAADALACIDALHRGELAGMTHAARSGGSSSWTRLLGSTPSDLDEARDALARFLASWCESAPVFSSPSTTTGVPRIQHSTPGLLGLLGLHFAQRLTGLPRAAACIVCGAPLEARRRSRLTCSDRCRTEWSRRGGTRSRAALTHENARLRRDNSELRAMLARVSLRGVPNT